MLYIFLNVILIVVILICGIFKMRVWFDRTQGAKGCSFKVFRIKSDIESEFEKPTQK